MCLSIDVSLTRSAWRSAWSSANGLAGALYVDNGAQHTVRIMRLDCAARLHASRRCTDEASQIRASLGEALKVVCCVRPLDKPPRHVVGAGATGPRPGGRDCHNGGQCETCHLVQWPATSTRRRIRAATTEEGSAPRGWTRETSGEQQHGRNEDSATGRRLHLTAEAWYGTCRKAMLTLGVQTKGKGGAWLNHEQPGRPRVP